MQQTYYDQFFQSYNQHLAQAFDRLTGQVEEEQLSQPGFYEQLRNTAMNSLRDWYDEPLPELNQLSPADFVSQVETPADLLDFFKIAAVACDEELPDILKQQMGKQAPDLSPRLLQLACDVPYMAAETASEPVQTAAAAIRLLGEWGRVSALEPLLDRFVNPAAPHEYLADALHEFCRQNAQAVLPLLQRRLLEASSGKRDWKTADEYLLIFLTDAAKISSTDVFDTLRSCFKKMPQKVIAAVCLGDYGDGRGVALLRSYIERHHQDIDRQLYYEALSSIKRLGGQTNDLPDPFHDFDSRTSQPS
ncbi:hypothetical protein HCH52_11610 [Oscillospiraceae bacterium HV4-5-C5C]|nr:hypothetical protein [Oscillospiraceae bacterium HV4-5-C5C]